MSSYSIVNCHCKFIESYDSDVIPDSVEEYDKTIYICNVCENQYDNVVDIVYHISTRHPAPSFQDPSDSDVTYYFIRSDQEMDYLSDTAENPSGKYTQPGLYKFHRRQTISKCRCGHCKCYGTDIEFIP